MTESDRNARSRRNATRDLNDPYRSPEFRTRLVHGAQVLVVFRVIGTAASFAGLQSSRPDIVRDAPVQWFIVVAFLAYLGWLGALWISSSELRYRLAGIRGLGFLFDGSRRALDGPKLYITETAVVVVFNLIFVWTLPRGTAYQQFTDLFSAASIAAVALITARYGLRRASTCLVIILAMEVTKAPLNNMGISEIDWLVVSSRILWVTCGAVVGAGMRKIWGDFGEHSETEVFTARLSAASDSTTHDFWKSNFKSINKRLADVLANNHEVALAARVDEALAQVTSTMAGPPLPQGRLSEVRQLCNAVAQLRNKEFSDMRFDVVPSGPDMPVFLAHPAEARIALDNLTTNAGIHSGGRRCSIRVELTGANEVRIHIRDDGQGLPAGHRPGEGLSHAYRAVQASGGVLERDTSVRRGTSWCMFLPAAPAPLDDASHEATVAGPNP